MQRPGGAVDRARVVRLLLVDGDASTRQWLRACLEEDGRAFRLHECATLESALATLEDERFDCALVDWDLPDGSGADFAMRSESSAPNLPVIVLTRDAHARRARAVLRAGAQDFLLKGEYQAAQLHRAIRYAIERKRATALKIRLQRANRLGATGQLAAGVAHEVNNPATWIGGNQQVLMAHLVDAQAQLARLQRLAQSQPVSAEALAEILQAPGLKDLGKDRALLAQNIDGMQRITRVVRALQGFSRVSEREANHANVNEAVREAVILMTPELKHRCTVDEDLQLLPEMVIDKPALVQLLVNVLMNACQAIDAAPYRKWHKVRIGTEVFGKQVRITIEDSGPGLPAGAEDDVFEPFYTTRDRREGAGMGLSICRDIAQRHRGTVRAQCSSLGGATFLITLPLRTGLTPKTEYASHQAQTPEKTAMEILIVDDEALIARALSRVLKGHQVHVADSALAGIQAMAHRNFDGILCDLMMPRHDGAWFLDQVVQQHPDKADAVVMMTGGAVIPRLKAFLAEQHDRMVLEKPFSRNSLKHVIDHWQSLPVVAASP